MSSGKKRRRVDSEETGAETTIHKSDANQDDQEVEEKEQDSLQSSEFRSEDASTSEESSEGEDEDEDPEDNTVDVTLEFFDPKEADFHGLKALLQSFLDGELFASSELVDTIIKQTTVGTVVKSGESEDPIGVLTVLNTQRYRGLQCLNQIQQYILQHCNIKETADKLTEAWSCKGTGLLISERLLNCPPQLGPPLQQALFDEIQWATEDEPTQELQDSFRFERYIAISRVFASPEETVQVHKRGKKQEKADEMLTVYARPEDEFYHKHSIASFSFPTGRTVGKDELQPRRLVMLLTKEQIRVARTELDGVVGNAAL